jgi:heparin binding hemagglutinin HbhA
VRGNVTALPSRTRASARGRLDQAAHVYGDLATRGRDIIGRIRSQKPVPELLEQAQLAVRQARAARHPSPAPTARTAAAPTETTGEMNAARSLHA